MAKKRFVRVDYLAEVRKAIRVLRRIERSYVLEERSKRKAAKERNQAAAALELYRTTPPAPESSGGPEGPPIESEGTAPDQGAADSISDDNNKLNRWARQFFPKRR